MLDLSSVYMLSGHLLPFGGHPLNSSRVILFKLIFSKKTRSLNDNVGRLSFSSNGWFLYAFSLMF